MFNALVDASDGPLQYSSGADDDLKKLYDEGVRLVPFDGKLDGEKGSSR